MRSAALALRLIAGVAALALAPACAKPPATGEPLADLTQQQFTDWEKGRRVFERVFTPETGLGPLFNAPSCASCHSTPVSGGAGPISVLHATAFLPNGSCDPLLVLGGPDFQQQVTPALHKKLGIKSEPIPSVASAPAVRTTPDLFGFGLLDAVPERAILERADPGDTDGDGISGRPNRSPDGRIGRFGRKAAVASLAEFNEGAFRNEMGVTVPANPDEGTVGGRPLPAGVDPLPEPEIGAKEVAQADAFVRFLAPPPPLETDGAAERGRDLFDEIGCTGCHVHELRTGRNDVAAFSKRDVAAYTDLLLHDMGPELADICLGLATPLEFRTEPLMGLRFATRYLHDGRAGSIETAIRLHGGEATASLNAFAALPARDRNAVLAFLNTL